MHIQKKQELAKEAIKHLLLTQKCLTKRSKDVDKKFRKKGVCFVTLYVSGKLRGCVGDVFASEALYLNIINNASRAALEDFRFQPIKLRELPKLKIEVSVLTEPETYKPTSINQLINYLESKKPGVIMEKFGRRAVFLPQVWQELPKAEEFLANLCIKMGLTREDWKDKDTRFRIFNLKNDI